MKTQGKRSFKARRLHWLVKAFLVLLVLYSVHLTWPYVYYREPIRDVRDLALIVPPLPDDHAGQTLQRLADTIEAPEVNIPFFKTIDAAELSAYQTAHAETLTAFWTWYDDGGKQALAPQTHAPKAARFFLYELEDPVAEPITATPRALVRLLLVQAYSDYQAGRTAHGRRALVAAFEITHFLLQNPDLLLSAVGYALLNQCQYVLAEMVPASEHTEDWSIYLAHRDLMTDVWRKVDWLSSCAVSFLFSDLYADHSPSGEAQNFWMYRFMGGYHAGHSLNMIYQAHQAFCVDIAGPIDASDFYYYKHDGDIDFFSVNPVGRYMLAISNPIRQGFLYYHAMITARGDILRVRLALQAAGLPWQREHVVAQLEAFGFRDPFTGEAYRVLENGDVAVWAAHDSRWRYLRSAAYCFSGMVGPLPELLSAENQALWQQQQPVVPFAETLQFAPPPPAVAPGSLVEYALLAEINPRLRQCFVESGPAEATVDDTGYFQWQVGDKDRGTVPIRVSLVDRDGEVVYHDFVVEIR